MRVGGEEEIPGRGGGIEICSFWGEEAEGPWTEGVERRAEIGGTKERVEETHGE